MKATDGRTLTVPNADDMDDETFVAHFEKRHADQMAGRTTLRLDDELTEMYRTFHDRIHELLPMTTPHEHLES